MVKQPHPILYCDPLDILAPKVQRMEILALLGHRAGNECAFRPLVQIEGASGFVI